MNQVIISLIKKIYSTRIFKILLAVIGVIAFIGLCVSFIGTLKVIGYAALVTCAVLMFCLAVINPVCEKLNLMIDDLFGTIGLFWGGGMFLWHVYSGSDLVLFFIILFVCAVVGALYHVLACTVLEPHFKEVREYVA